MARQTTIRSAQTLGAAVYAARKQKGWRQSDLARRASVRQQLISDLENGIRTPRLDTMVKVLAALDLDLTVAPRQARPFDPSVY